MSPRENKGLAAARPNRPKGPSCSDTKSGDLRDKLAFKYCVTANVLKKD